MAQVVITIKIMPEDPEVDLSKLEKEALEAVKDFAGETETKVEKDPIGFGLTALKVIFVAEESKSNLDPLEDQLRNIDGVQSVEVTDVRRAFG